MKVVAFRPFVGILALAATFAACETKSPTDDPGTEQGTLALAVGVTTVTLEQGGTATIPVTITRGGGFTGSVTVNVEGVPAGVSSSEVTIAAGATTGTATLTANATATPGAANLTVRAHGTNVPDATKPVALNTTVRGTYTLAATPATLSVAAGGTVRTDISAVRVNNFGGGVAVTATAPAGLTATLLPGVIGPTLPSAGLDIAVAGTVAPGTYNVTVQGVTAGLANQTVTVVVTVTAPGSFTMTANPATLNIAQGAQATSTITIARTGSFTAPVALTANATAAMTVSFNPASVTGTTSVVSITVSAGLAPGTYPVVVNGNATGVAQQSTTISVTVPTAAPTPALSLAVLPSPIAVVAGASGNATLNISRLGGFTGAVSVTADAAPAGLTVGINPTSVATGASTAAISVSALGSVAAGTYNITLRANGTGVAEAVVTVPVTVSAAPGTLGIAVAPTAVSVAAGASANTTLTATRGGSFTGAVALTADAAPAGITVAFTPASIAGGSATSTIAISAASSVAPGTYNVTVRANGTGVTEQSVVIPVTVTAAGGFTMAIAPTSLSVAAGASGATTLTLTRTNGFTGTVNLTATAPAGVTVTFTPSAVTALTSTVSVAVAGGTAAGLQNVTIRANATGLAEQTVALPVTITAGQVTSGNVTFNFCGSSGIPLFVAAKNGGGPWQPVGAAGNGSYSFQIDALGSISYVVPVTGGGFRTEVFSGTTADLQRQGAGLCAQLTGAGKVVNGTVTGINADGTHVVMAGLGKAQGTVVGSNVTFNDVDNGTVDLIAGRTAVGFDLGTFLPTATTDKMVLRRNLNPAAGSTLPVIDMSTGFTPAQATATLTNLGAGPSDFTTGAYLYSTANGSYGAYGITSSGPSTTRPWYGVPAAQQVAGDLHVVTFAASGQSDATNSRVVTVVSTIVKALTFAFGPLLNAPTVSVVGTAPYVRLRAVLAIQAQYGNQFIASYQQQGATPRTVNVSATSGFTGSATATLEIPDLSGVAGWNNTWGLVAGVSTPWSVSATGYSNGTPTTFVDGNIYMSASKTGTITP
ncbi:MAG: hypothetical protein ABIV28_06075 [Longimicrobiales bacterium]